LIGFVAITLWAWSGKRKGEFERAAHLPLDEQRDGSEDAR
jgi:cbb3-type cytochrome oxidase subunit 3